MMWDFTFIMIEMRSRNYDGDLYIYNDRYKEHKYDVRHYFIMIEIRDINMMGHFTFIIIEIRT